ncbi:DUF6164 family protein [Aquimonas voraii]|uniref:Signal transducing protein n=1 Tax=Aquimonas voraii TaxID=265719 RepID=A0A1G6XZ77_9GAMM|nr:DUF6164 family protein [Aquimonas voraii]SDD82685.1 hypothetical protein SAMN04488509_10816 [Aquimonas voraii]
MGVRLMGLRDVPEDELAGLVSTLQTAGIEHYQSPPGLFGLSPAALWVKHASDLSEAQRLLAEFQTQRAEAARAAWRSAREAGEVPGLWASIRARPWHTLGLIVLVLGVLFALSLPMLGLGR